jgi:hypothetical protein
MLSDKSSGLVEDSFSSTYNSADVVCAYDGNVYTVLCGKQLVNITAFDNVGYATVYIYRDGSVSGTYLGQSSNKIGNDYIFNTPIELPCGHDIYILGNAVGTGNRIIYNRDTLIGTNLNFSFRLDCGINQGNSYIHNFDIIRTEDIPPCSENWLRINNLCIMGNKLIEYYDDNMCGSYNNLSSDNNTYESCPIIIEATETDINIKNGIYILIIFILFIIMKNNEKMGVI